MTARTDPARATPTGMVCGVIFASGLPCHVKADHPVHTGGPWPRYEPLHDFEPVDRRRADRRAADRESRDDLDEAQP